MRGREDVEAYLMRSREPFEEIAPDTWVVRVTDGHGEHVVVRLAESLVLFRMKVVALGPARPPASLLERLLELNAAEMVHGAYGIADGAIVITATFRLDHLDFEEFRATLDDFSLALTNHRDILAAARPPL